MNRRHDTDDGWSEALEQLRGRYGDSYSARIELGADIMRQAETMDVDVPQECAGEAVLQPILRYQDTDPADVRTLIENKHGDEKAAMIRQAIIRYAGVTS